MGIIDGWLLRLLGWLGIEDGVVKGNGGCDGQTWNQKETYRDKFKPCPVEKETAIRL